MATDETRIPPKTPVKICVHLWLKTIAPRGKNILDVAANVSSLIQLRTVRAGSHRLLQANTRKGGLPQRHRDAEPFENNHLFLRASVAKTFWTWQRT